jgi:DNA (cytosine-5)-methyltransferase 1
VGRNYLRRWVVRVRTRKGGTFVSPRDRQSTPAATGGIDHHVSQTPAPKGDRSSSRGFADSPTRKPRLLDLFCCAGGAAVGYHRAGFEVVGIDIDPQPNYPFEFVQADALEALTMGFFRRNLTTWAVRDFNAIHASPPCQAYSDLQNQNKREYPDLVGPVRELLRATGLPYVIENVPEAPLIEPVILCGTMFDGLRVIRHRGFETNWPLTAPTEHPKHPLVFTHDKRKAHHGKLDQDTSFVQVTGGGNCTVANKRDAMGVHWMTGKEANEAIPPAYTSWVGMHLAVELVEARVAVAA